MHYFWVGAVPAMLFLGVVMMPFYYGSKVRSVPEFMNRRFGTAAHLVNALSFALAQLLIAGINLYLLANIVEIILGWNLYLSLVAAAVVVLTYTTLGGLSAAIYNEVLQFFVIVAALLPLTIVGLHKVGGYGGLKDKVAASPGGGEQLSSWPGTALTGFDSPLLSVIGIVFGLGFVLSFGYWTTNFVEVQRAMASSSISAAQRAPIIGAFPKMFIPFIVIFPGMIAGVLVNEISEPKSSGGTPDYNNALLYLIRDLLPNGMLGVAIAGLLASFMAGMAANISAFNTVFSYDLWQTYVKKDKPDDYYTRVGRIATVAATVIAIGTALFAASYSNIMDYLQTLFGFFNAPLFATFILGMFWKRMSPAAGWIGLVSGTLAAVFVGRAQPGRPRADVDRRHRALRAGRELRRGRRGLRRRHPGQRGRQPGDGSQAGVGAARPGLLVDAEEGLPRRQRGHAGVVPAADPARRHRTRRRRRPQHHLLVRERPMSEHNAPRSGNTGSVRADHGATGQAHKAGAFDIRVFIASLIGIYGVVLLIASFFVSDDEMEKADGLNINLYAGIGMVVVAGLFLVWARLRPVVVPDDTSDTEADSAEGEGEGGPDAR